MATIPHATGKDFKFSFFINGTPVAEFDIKSFSVTRNVTDVTDREAPETGTSHPL